MYQVGDLLCYPMHGVGVVERIEEQTILGETTQYFVLRFLMGRMTAMVPVNSAEKVGLRALVDRATCENVIAFLDNDEVSTESGNWNQRYRENLEKLRLGDIHIVADVVKCLMSRDREKGLSAGERKMFLTARQVLVAELAAAMEVPESTYMPLVGEKAE